MTNGILTPQKRQRAESLAIALRAFADAIDHTIDANDHLGNYVNVDWSDVFAKVVFKLHDMALSTWATQLSPLEDEIDKARKAFQEKHALRTTVSGLEASHDQMLEWSKIVDAVTAAHYGKRDAYFAKLAKEHAENWRGKGFRVVL